MSGMKLTHLNSLKMDENLDINDDIVDNLDKKKKDANIKYKDVNKFFEYDNESKNNKPYNKSEIEKILGIKLDDSNFKQSSNNKLKIYNLYKDNLNLSDIEIEKKRKNQTENIFKSYDILGKYSKYDKELRNFVNLTISPEEFDQGSFYYKLLSLNDEDFNKFMGSDYGKFFISLSKEEIEACIYYTNFDYRRINSSLRERKIDKFVEKKVELIDGAIYKYGGLKEDTILYRGLDFSKSLSNNTILDKLMSSIDLSNIEQIYSVFDSLKGMTIIDEGYMSSSTSISGIVDGNIVMKIKAPKGTAGMDISILSSIVIEDEFLMARDTKLTIDNVSIENGENGQYVNVECSANSNYNYDKSDNKHGFINELVSDVNSIAKKFENRYNEYYKKEINDYGSVKSYNSFIKEINDYGDYLTVKNRIDVLKRLKEILENGE